MYSAFTRKKPKADAGLCEHIVDNRNKYVRDPIYVNSKWMKVKKPIARYIRLLSKIAMRDTDINLLKIFYTDIMLNWAKSGKCPF